MKKKETILSVLKEIRDILKQTTSLLSLPSEKISEDEIVIDIPAELSMKDIVEKCDNKISKGTPLLYSTWLLNEDFYKNEKTRGQKIAFSKNIFEESRNKTWYQQEELLKKYNSFRLNGAEILYILWKHEKETGERLLEKYHYYWTSTKTSEGYLLSLGDFDTDGARVISYRADNSRSHLGLCLSRRLI